MRILRAALDARDGHNGTRSEAPASLAVTVARRVDADFEQSGAIEQVALLHDIGKVCVPDHIMQKDGPLDEAEWQTLRRHPTIGAQIVGSVPALAHLAPAIRAEHECWDGTGYPGGLGGDQIPLFSRIVHACHALNAMTSDRPFRKAMAQPIALRAMDLHAGTQFDPTVVGALLDAVATDTELSASTSRNQQPSVLAVEDDATFRLALEHGLASKGFDVDVAATANEAYRLAGKGHFDVILLDWLFSVGDSGASACRRLRYLHPASKIVVLTGLDDIRDRRVALESGATVVLQKGISLETLADRLHRVVHTS